MTASSINCRPSLNSLMGGIVVTTLATTALVTTICINALAKLSTERYPNKEFCNVSYFQCCPSEQVCALPLAVVASITPLVVGIVILMGVYQCRNRQSNLEAETEMTPINT